MINIHLLSVSSIPEVLSLQGECYRPELIESEESFLTKLRICPETCFGARDEHRLCGYAFAHPWKIGEIVHLDSDSYSIPPNADGMYIHDVAVLPACRHHQVARRLVEAVAMVADRWSLPRFALVAVQSSEPFWSRFGFAIDRSLVYAPGVTASYMICEGAPRWR